MSQPLFSVHNLNKSFGTLHVLQNVELTVERGERIALIGPSGTGKSVLLRCIAMLEKPDGGEIMFGDTDIAQRGVNLNLFRQKMGMVYQGFHLFSHMSVLENIIFAPVRVKKMPRIQVEQKAVELLEMVGLKDKLHAMPDTLSGGQKQRVAIARCLAMEPDLLLLDEPTSALDPVMTAEVMAIIRKLAQTGLTLILVTHEMDFAKEFASRVLYLDECGIYEEGSPDRIFGTPQRPKTISFINRLKVFMRRIDSTGFDLVGMSAELEVYFNKYGLGKKQLFDLQLLLEELLMILFHEQFSDKQPDIELAVQYSGTGKSLQIHMSYGGESFDPFEGSRDELSEMLINRLCSAKSQEYSDGINIIDITLRDREVRK